MSNNNTYENDSRVIEYQKKIYDIQKEYYEAERLRKQKEKEDYKKWYDSLDEASKIDEDIRVSKEKIKQMNAKKKKLVTSKKTDKRAERTHLLIQLGAQISSLLKKELNRDIVSGDEKILAGVLSNTFKNSGDNIFVSLWKKEETNRSSSAVRFEVPNDQQTK